MTYEFELVLFGFLFGIVFGFLFDDIVKYLINRRKKIMLKDIRESRGMSQQDLADKSGINKRTIQVYEQGYRNINGAKLSTLLTFANVLNCSIDQIVIDESLIAMINTYREKICKNNLKIEV